MAKISIASIKYMIRANFNAEGALEKPDVIGALFGQTEGLLGADLELRELQKEGKIGRIEVILEKRRGITVGEIKIPTSLDQTETTLIAAAIETIEKIGPCDSQIEVDKIEDVREDKKKYIIERAKKLVMELKGEVDSKEVTNKVKESVRVSKVKEYGKNKLAFGDISGKEIIVVEGRADVINLLRNNVKNVIGMDGIKLPEEIKELGKTKEITLFVDGDRGGKLITKNVLENVNVKYVTSAPDGKEVEELTSKEILMSLRKKREVESYKGEEQLTDEKKEILKSILDKLDSKEIVFLNKELREVKRFSLSRLSRSSGKGLDVKFLVVGEIVTNKILEIAEKIGVEVIIAKNFEATNTKIKLLSL